MKRMKGTNEQTSPREGLLPCLHPELIEAGCDEAGRGCLAGSVFAAAVILPPDFHHPLLNDSKQMTEKRRDQLRKIIEQEAVAWSVQEVTAERIDKINILNASIEGMNLAIKALSIKPEFIVVDGNRFKTDLEIPYRTIVKGDGKYANIAAASVLAKTHRDEYMMRLAEEYPMYGWAKNKGYPTREHRLAVREHGLSPYHRLSFNCSPEQLELF
jgi:ribonuclease HII